MEYKYHHIWIPVTEPRQGERYSPSIDIYTLGG
ncbi:helicase, partial [Francisella tularensis subsp. holarctica]|nr:helicase [Francisella tularensis subsp. holarctica]